MMLTTIWTSPNTAEVFFLVAAIVAGLLAVLELVARDPIDALLPAAVCLIAVGFLAL